MFLSLSDHSIKVSFECFLLANELEAEIRPQSQHWQTKKYLSNQNRPKKSKNWYAQEGYRCTQQIDIMCVYSDLLLNVGCRK